MTYWQAGAPPSGLRANVLSRVGRCRQGRSIDHYIYTGLHRFSIEIRTVFRNERPVPVTLTVSRPSMVTPVDVVHLFVASIVSEASVVHDCRPEGQLMFRDPDTISFPSTQL